MREHRRRGADLIKIMPSGGIASSGDDPRQQLMTDEEMRGQTDIFRARLADGVKLDDLLPEAFATVREAAKRTLGQRHYDVQMIGGKTF